MIGILMTVLACGTQKDMLCLPAEGDMQRQPQCCLQILITFELPKNK